MPHGLGSPGDFGPRPEFVDHGDPEGENLRRIEDIIAAEEAEILGPEADVDETPAEEPEEAEDMVLEPISVEELQNLILGPGNGPQQYAFERQYVIMPQELVLMVVHEIIDRDEARHYLRAQGIELFG